MVHLNDSRSELGSRRDRHEHIGAGRIGGAGLGTAAHPPGARRTSTYMLETPGMDEGYDGVNLDRVRDLAAGRPLAPLPPAAFQTRSAKGRSAPAPSRAPSRRGVRDAAASSVGAARAPPAACGRARRASSPSPP